MEAGPLKLQQPSSWLKARRRSGPDSSTLSSLPNERLPLLVTTVVEHISRGRKLNLQNWRGIIMKSYRVTATFPEFPAAHAVQEARGQASTLSAGIKRALDAILCEPHVKGRRILTVKLFVRMERPENELP